MRAEQDPPPPTLPLYQYELPLCATLKHIYMNYSVLLWTVRDRNFPCHWSYMPQ